MYAEAIGTDFSAASSCEGLRMGDAHVVRSDKLLTTLRLRAFATRQAGCRRSHTAIRSSLGTFS